MLPIVKRRTLEIPHGLAALAAAVCLVLAFASDIQSDDHALRAEAASRVSGEIATTVSADESRSETARPTESERPIGQRPAKPADHGLMLIFPRLLRGDG